MKKEYDIKDTVWIHMGERKLTRGRVVEIIDLEHLNEGHDPNYELYVIEVHSGIDPVYEVRDFGQISPDAQGPIALFRRDGLVAANRYLRKVGLPIPQFEEWNAAKESAPKKMVTVGGYQPKTSEGGSSTPPNQGSGGTPKKKKYYYKRKPKKASA